MKHSYRSRTGLFGLITAAHLAALWAILSGLNPKSQTTAPSPLPVIVAEMLPQAQVQSRDEARPRPQVRKSEPKPETRQPPKPVPMPAAKPAVRTTDSKNALSAPKAAESSLTPAPPDQTDSVSPPHPAPEAAATAQASATAPASLVPPRFNAAYLNNPNPAYPPLLRRAGKQGRVVLRVFVTVEGLAGEVLVLKSSGAPLFDEAALESVRKWRFVPAKRGDVPVAEWVQVPIEFKLN